MLTHLEKQSNNQRIPHWGFCIKNGYEGKINYTGPKNVSNKSFVSRKDCKIVSNKSSV